MRRFLPLLAVPLLVAASAPVQAPAETVDAALQRLRGEARTADRQVQRLEQVAGRARGEAARLRALRAAAAGAAAGASASSRGWSKFPAAPGVGRPGCERCNWRRPEPSPPPKRGSALAMPKGG